MTKSSGSRWFGMSASRTIRLANEAASGRAACSFKENDMKTIVAITALAAAALLGACTTSEEDSAFNASTPAPVLADAAPAQHVPSETEAAR